MKYNKNYIILITICILVLVISTVISSNNYSFELFNNETNFNNTGMYVLYIPKREKYIKNVMKKLKFNPEFVQGYNKNTLDLKKMKKEGKIGGSGRVRNSGVVSVYMGHKSIYEKFLESSNKFALIFEDDIAVDNYDEKNSKIINLTNNIPPDADIVYFGYCTESCSVAKKYNDLFFHSVNPNCLHCYLVTRQGAQKILDSSQVMNNSIDEHIRILISSKKIKAYNANYEYFTIKQNRYDMGSELNNNQNLRECKEMK